MPIITLDKSYLPRPWYCEECRTVLGFVFRDTKRIKRLWELRKQIKANDIVINYDGLLLNVGTINNSRLWRGMAIDAGWFRCDTCGSVQEWRASDDALRDLIRKARGEEAVKIFDELERR